MKRAPWIAAASCALAACVQSPSIADADLVGLGAIAGEVDPARLIADVQEFSAAHAGDTPLPCSDPTGADHWCHLTRDAARALFRQKLAALGYSVTEQAIGTGDWATTNVFADKPGATRPDDRVLVGAHFDAFYGGADDNSSGVAAVLEIARILSSRSFDRTLRFIGFDLEETGLTGSTRYVENAGADGVVAALVFDCIGYASSEPHSQLSLPGLPAPDIGDFVAVIANEPSRARALEARGLDDALSLARMTAIVAPGDGASPIAGNLMRSDHAPFWLAGRDALFFTDTANFRNPHYHRDGDLPATLDPAFLAGATELAAATAAYWAGGPR